MLGIFKFQIHLYYFLKFLVQCIQKHIAIVKDKRRAPVQIKKQKHHLITNKSLSYSYAFINSNLYFVLHHYSYIRRGNGQIVLDIAYGKYHGNHNAKIGV